MTVPTAHPDSRPFRLALLGVFGVGNFGNEATLDVVLSYIKTLAPECAVWCISSRPEAVRAGRGLPSFPLGPTSPLGHRLNRNALTRGLKTLFLGLPVQIVATFRMLATILRVRALLIPGTGVLDDFGMRPTQLPFDLFRWCLLARIARRPVFFLAAGAGPIEHPLSRWLMKSAAQIATYRSFRDKTSREFMLRLGVKAHGDKIVPDLVFASVNADIPARRCHAPGNLTVAIGVMAFFGWRNRPDLGETIYRCYLQKIAAFVSWLLQQGHSVRIIIGDHADTRPANELLAIVAPPESDLHAGKLTVPEIPGFPAVLREIASCDAVVATRFHNVVAALMLERPTIAIGYGGKCEALMASVGLGAFCQKIDDFNLGTLCQQFTRLISEFPEIKAQLQTSAASYRQDAATNISQFLTTVFPGLT